jgi:hypothetical protein
MSLMGMLVGLGILVWLVFWRPERLAARSGCYTERAGNISKLLPKMIRERIVKTLFIQQRIPCRKGALLS